MIEYPRKIKLEIYSEFVLGLNPLSLLQLGPLAFPGLLYNTYQSQKNIKETSGNEKAIALIYEPTLIEFANLTLGNKGKISDFFTERDIRLDFKHNAASRDLREVLENDTYQSIVVVGQGSRSSWSAKDGVVTTIDLKEWMKDLPLKTGYFLQMTCGNDRGISFGDRVLEDKTKSLGYIQGMSFADRFEAFWGENNQEYGLVQIGNSK